ncbi:proteinase-activated receptor 1-like [Pristis pectinata]|uniref:proteinase-activated receptor 1-like n=1 Tax=Pristis pectinata TaxID=685728 RepID=UPI00223DD728|nr:proteinase-activated receptor 1-like [Pristis pectinata]
MLGSGNSGVTKSECWDQLLSARCGTRGNSAHTVKSSTRTPRGLAQDLCGFLQGLWIGVGEGGHRLRAQTEPDRDFRENCGPPSLQMSWKVQLVMWVALLPVAVALQSGNHSQGKVRPRTFAGILDSEPNEFIDLEGKIEGEGEGSGHYEGSGLREGSGFELDENGFIDPVKNSKKLSVTIPESAREYLTSQWITVFIPSVYTIIFAIGLLFNCIAILTIHFKMTFDKPTVIYMLNLALADLLFVLLLPLKISYYFSGNDWSFGSFLCRLVNASFYAYMHCSVLLMMCISVDRFVAIVFPIRSSSWRSPRRAVALCFVVWLLTFGGAMPLFLIDQTVYITNLNITTCHDVLPLSVLQNYFTYYFPILCALFFVIPLVVTTVCYVGIISALSSTNVGSEFKKTSAIILAVIVLSVFIVCFAPTNIILLIHYLHLNYAANDTLYFVYMLCVCIGSLSCCLDPLIYYYASSLFQKHLKNLFCSKNDTKSGSSQTGSKSCKTGNTNFNDSTYKKLLA